MTAGLAPATAGLSPAEFRGALARLNGPLRPTCTPDRILSIAGRTIRIRPSNAKLGAGALRALSHHDQSAPNAAPILTIDLFDHDEPNHPLRAVPPGVTDASTSERVPRWTYHGPEGRALFHDGFRALFLLNHTQRRAALWLGEDEDLPYHLVTSPLLPILSWFLTAMRCSVVHAAAVETRDGAVLLAGRSGTGKSTAALACLADGFGFLGDDMCVIDLGPEPVVHSLFCSAKLDAADLDRFPALAGAVAGGPFAGSDKAVYLFDQHLAERMTRRAPLLGIAIPQRGESPDRRLSAREAFLAMAPNTAFQLPGLAREACAGVKALVSSVPVHAVSVGNDLRDIAPRLRSFAATLRATKDEA